MMMSHSTMSGRSSCTFSRASRPLPTVTTSKSSSEKVSSMTFWIVMLSSASRIFLPIAPSASRAQTGAPARCSKIDGSCPSVNDLSGLAASGGGPHGLFDDADHVLGRGAGQEDLGHSEGLELRDVLGGDDPPEEHLHAFHAFFAEQLLDPPADR